MARAWPALAMSALRRREAALGAILIRRMASSSARQVVDRPAPFAGPGLGAHGVQRLGDAGVPGGVVAHRVPGGGRSARRSGQPFLVELVDGVGGVEAEVAALAALGP